ncbi:MAG: peptide chain release factor N(5)-glutamine methyltransferase [Gammaproteobacteria bacterium]|nr:peptide chain release factor N(5)-glutamine methyltransferase [Gammaproteobacteria bacterium]
MSVTHTLAQARQAGILALQEQQTSAGLDVDCLLTAVTGLSRSQILAFDERLLSAHEYKRYTALLARRQRGEPIAHLIGYRDFIDFTIKVAPSVLIPRPETEHLVEAALEQPADRVLDLGTGSGCIAIALARAWPASTIHAVDRSPEALEIAQQNARALQADQIRFFAGDWYAPVAVQQYALIVSNPPYIGLNEPELQQGDVRFEPSLALTSGTDGLSALRQIIAGAPARLAAGGRLWVEHGYQQAQAVRELMAAQHLIDIETRYDLAGHERITGGRTQ